jgi:hypothetical protein
VLTKGACKFMWRITKDFLFEERNTLVDNFPSQVGRGTKEFDESKCIHKFRLFDDDGKCYYEGLNDTNDDDNAFEPLDYYESHSGCTEIQYQDRITGKWETL